MNIKFIQNAGIGDIIFLEPIARKLYLEGHHIYWDTIDIYTNIEKYIPYVRWNSDINNYDRTYNFQFLNMTGFNCRILEAKYQYANVPFNNWRSFHYNRDFLSEHNLIDKINFNINKPYRLIHDEYATHSEFKINIPENPDIQNVYIKPIENYSIFDWSTIIENAYEIHVVSTSSLFLIEKLHLVNNPTLNLYARGDHDPDLYETSYLLSKNWKLFPKKR